MVYCLFFRETMHLQLPIPEPESVPGNRALSAGDEEP